MSYEQVNYYNCLIGVLVLCTFIGFVSGYFLEEIRGAIERRSKDRELFPKGTVKIYNYKGEVSLESDTLVSLSIPPLQSSKLVKVGATSWEVKNDGLNWDITVHFTTYKPPEILKVYEETTPTIADKKLMELC